MFQTLNDCNLLGIDLAIHTRFDDLDLRTGHRYVRLITCNFFFFYYRFLSTVVEMVHGCLAMCLLLVNDNDIMHCPVTNFTFLVSTSVFIALSTVFHSINSLNNSLFSHSVLLVLALPYWSLQLYIYNLFMKVFFSPQ